MSDTIPTLPLEIFHEIAKKKEQAFWALLAIPDFARSLDLLTIEKYKSHFGYKILLLETQSGSVLHYYKHNLSHRRFGPAFVSKNQYHTRTEWRMYGKLHREDGPAFIEEGKFIKKMIWYWYDTVHRLDGAAHITVRQNDKDKIPDPNAPNILYNNLSTWIYKGYILVQVTDGKASFINKGKRAKRLFNKLKREEVIT